ncbi:MAG: hypothetical protein IJB97_05310 [Clostridia bacterium]|nr:hypothetical protein [Clostridia bacterium]
MRNVVSKRNVIFIQTLKWLPFFRFVGAAALVFLCCACLAAGRLVKLPVERLGTGGQNVERTFYLYSASSQAEMRVEIGVFDVPFLKGESVILNAGRGGMEARLTAAKQAVKEKGGKIVKEERLDGVCSLYCRLPEAFGLYGGVTAFGENVNLHIAIAETRTVVGSPIIFGGY